MANSENIESLNMTSEQLGARIIKEIAESEPEFAGKAIDVFFSIFISITLSPDFMMVLRRQLPQPKLKIESKIGVLIHHE